MKNELEKDMQDIIELKTCKQFEKFDDMKEIVDDFGDDIKHHLSLIHI